MKKIYTFIFLLIHFSCEKPQSYLEAALEAAGDNRPELQKVLDYFKNDSLKYKAAVFLIENMPGHYSHAGDEALKYYEIGKKVLLSDLTSVQQRDTLLKISEQQFPFLNDRTIEDIQIIRSDYLIKNIENAFELWETKPWARHLNFDQFCEYLLPYKCFELQQLDNWRDTLSGQFNSDLSAMLFNDEKYDSPYNAAITVRSEIERKVIPKGLFNQSGYPFMSASTMYRIKYGRCTDYVNLAVATMRGLGIPVIIESTPQWGRYRAGHSWYTLLNDKGEHLTSEWDVTTDPGHAFFPYERIPKVYRHTYSVNRQTVGFLIATSNREPFSIFTKDVTDKYFATSDLRVPLIKKGATDKYVYIAAFNGRTTDWSVMDYGEVRNGKAEFRKMGRNVLYLALGYGDFGRVPISHPFIVHKNGDIQYIDPDLTNLQQVVLRRKYYANENVVSMQHRVLGGMIQASNTPSFSSYVTLYTIDDLEYPDQIKLPTDKPYRYWRYMAPKGSYGSIAELRFFQTALEGDTTTEMWGKPISSIGGDNDIVKRAFDGDWLTNFETDDPDGSWVGMDFGKPVRIDKVRCVQRNDDNNVRPGDLYELSYWDAKGWKSLGERRAEDNYIVYDGVPEGALLWLKNHTRGWDERAFLYKNGKQEWW